MLLPTAKKGVSNSLCNEFKRKFNSGASNLGFVDTNKQNVGFFASLRNEILKVKKLTKSAFNVVKKLTSQIVVDEPNKLVNVLALIVVSKSVRLPRTVIKRFTVLVFILLNNFKKSIEKAIFQEIFINSSLQIAPTEERFFTKKLVCVIL